MSFGISGLSFLRTLLEIDRSHSVVSNPTPPIVETPPKLRFAA
jgi:hypothetical protein